jgi:hypothetical protein
MARRSASAATETPSRRDSGASEKPCASTVATMTANTVGWIKSPPA